MWDGNPGDTYTFMVITEMVAWQEAYFIAANPEDMLRMLSLGDPGLLGYCASADPQVSYNHLPNAVDQLIFVE